MGRIMSLKESPFSFTTEQGVKFMFTTAVRARRFEKVYKSNRAEIQSRMFTRYGVYCNCSLLSDINTYRKIETNGFRVVMPDGVVENIADFHFRLTRV